MSSNVLNLKDYSKVVSTKCIDRYNYPDYIMDKNECDCKKCEKYKNQNINEECTNIIAEDDEKLLNICKQIQDKVNNSKISVLFEDDNEEDDEDDKNKGTKTEIFSTSFKNEYRTSGYVGVIRTKVETSKEQLEDITLSISSRFDSGKNQYFLNYVFAKAFDKTGRIFKDLKPMSSPDETWDVLLMYIYIDKLEDAFNQGMFRKYTTFEYNDSKVKGRLDVSRHIKTNFINNGKIAYSTREYTVNNHINQLILMAYEYLRRRYGILFENQINSNKTLKNGIQILKNSIPDYKSQNARYILSKTYKPIYHSVYLKYEPLRQISISILKRLGLNMYADSKDEVSGVLIRADKLWEKFLYNTIFSNIPEGKVVEQFSLPVLIKEPKQKPGKREFNPDFYLEGKFVFDAKYKKPWSDIVVKEQTTDPNKKNKPSWSKYVRDDVFQVLGYMLAFNVKVGGTIFPVPVDEEESRLQKDELINDYIISDLCQDRKFYIVPYKIPTYAKSQSEFNELMEKQNEYILEKIKLMYNN